MKQFRKRRDPVELIILLLGGFLVVMLAFFMARGDLDAYTQLLLQGGVKEETTQVVERPLVGTDYPERSETATTMSESEERLIIEEEREVIQESAPGTVTPGTVLTTPSPPPIQPKPTPTSIPLQSAPPPTGNFYLQAGAFSSEGNANNMVNALREMGFGATVEKSGNLYKVKIYGFKNKQEASEAVQKIKSKGFDAFIGQ
ncbi:MAG: SPOR domain-containing protein [Candidatus Atribacteria bacterium]|nr:SPOR domain-containing protein [Candidatus Atribacteria bacterium]